MLHQYVFALCFYASNFTACTSPIFVQAYLNISNFPEFKYEMVLWHLACYAGFSYQQTWFQADSTDKPCQRRIF